MLFNKNKIGKTNPTIMFLTVLILIIIPAFCIWLFLGEIDLLNNDYLVSHNGSLWKGNITGSISVVEWINEKYKPTPPVTINDGYVNIKNNGELILNPIMIVYALIPVFIAVIFPIFLIILKKAQFDIYVLSISFSLAFFIFIICGLIPLETNGWKWMLGLAIAFLTFFVIFIPTNKITNAILSTTKAGVRMAIDLQTDRKITRKYEKDLKDLINNNGEKDNIEYIEVEE